MNSPHNNFSDDFERRLAQLSIVEPSSSYHSLARNLERVAPQRSPWRFPAVFASAFAIVIGIGMQLNIDPARNDLSAPSDPSIATGASSQNPAFVSGIHYTELASPRSVATVPSTATKVFFYYPCYPCYEFQSVLGDWRASSADDIPLTYVPATWSEDTRYYAQVFYAAEFLGVQAELHERLFDALHLEDQPLDEQQLLTSLFASVGVTQQQYLSALNSEQVRERVQEAERLNNAFSIQSVPALIVECRYRITPNSEIGQQEMVDVAQYLMDRPHTEEAQAC